MRLVLLFGFLCYLLPGFSQLSQKELVVSGITKAKLGDYEAAITDFNVAISLDSTEAEPWYNRGVARDYLEDHAGAILDYSKAILMKPEYPEAFYNRGLARFNLGQFSEAINDFNEAIRIDPTPAEYFSSRGATKASRGEYREAIIDLNEAIFKRPKDVNPRLNKALAFMYLKQYAEAEKAYSEIIDIDPSIDEAYANRGVTRQYLDDLVGACEDWKIASSLGSEKVRNYIQKFCNR